MGELTDKNPVGRPPKYKTVEDMQRIIDLYFLACRVRQEVMAGIDTAEQRLEVLSEEDMLIINSIEDTHPIISGLSYTLGMTTEGFRHYGENDEFSATVKTAKQRVEMNLEQRLAGTAVTGSIFSLKNNFGWKDKTEQELSGSLQVSEMTNEQIDKRMRELKDLDEPS